uniref:DNA 5'-3' helicase n=1 Tax=Choreocolax polysiphoniae TaxID=282351 RepID=A0A0B5W3B8_9FLOR|nr:replicative DNA helicase [Choreocolax polysiphoniae]AJH65885.1 replicative DNA helicase [Choreocolax polysiphoniae]
MNKLKNYKTIPQNYLAEEILIGILLIYPNTLNYISYSIQKDFFFLESNQIIYLNILKIFQKQNINIITLFYQLKSNKLLQKIGGFKNLIRIMKQSQIFMCSSKKKDYIKELIKLINNSYIKRLLIQYGHNIIRIGYIKKIQNYYIYNKILLYLNSIERNILNDINNKTLKIKDLISRELIQIKYQKIYNIKKNINKSIRSGFLKLDNIILSLPNGNLIIIAGRPSIGKTSLAIHIAYNIFLNQQVSILIFSLEMSNKEIINKIISIACRTEINTTTINSLNKKQWKNITNICFKLLNNNIYLNDKNNVIINKIEKVAKKLKKIDKKIQLIIIDYLQLIELSSEINKKYNRSQELGYITRKLKLLAQFLQIPIIILSQLNRNIEIRSDKEPLLSDLKESGCIKYTDNIITYNKLINEINIYNMIDMIKDLKTYKYIMRKKYKIKIYISYKYIFICQNINKKIFLTSNQKYLSQIKWIKLNYILLSTTINIILKIVYSIEKKYINKIILNNYNKTYDINKNNKFSLICKKIILHNSIEQDADIILILYNKKNEINNLENKKTINIKIAKNRNGISGSCEMFFIPKTNIFQEK